MTNGKWKISLFVGLIRRFLNVITHDHPKLTLLRRRQGSRIDTRRPPLIIRILPALPVPLGQAVPVDFSVRTIWARPGYHKVPGQTVRRNFRLIGVRLRLRTLRGRRLGCLTSFR